MFNYIVCVFSFVFLLPSIHRSESLENEKAVLTGFDRTHSYSVIGGFWSLGLRLQFTGALRLNYYFVSCAFAMIHVGMGSDEDLLFD